MTACYLQNGDLPNRRARRPNGIASLFLLRLDLRSIFGMMKIINLAQRAHHARRLRDRHIGQCRR